jgi:uncharacterized membrane protein YgcG
MLWLLVPIWISWFFAEFFQEKEGTSLGNAITNAVVVLWGSIDCSRQTIRFIQEGVIYGFANIFARFSLLVILFAYGTIIVIMSWKGNKMAKYIGRVREVTYVFAMFTPIFYNAMELTVKHVLAAVLFFPLFYFVIELIDRNVPDPKAMVEDMANAKGRSSSGGLSDSSSFGGGSGSGDIGKDPFVKDPFGSAGSVGGKDAGKNDIGKDLGGLDDFKF